MSTIKTTNITHGSNSGTENIVLASNGNVTVAGALSAGSFTGAGITHIDTWRVTSDMSIGNAHITTNWSRATDTLTAQLGAQVTESSGVFTLPVAGIWQVVFQAEVFSSSENRWVEGRIDGSTDGFSSNTTALATGYTNLFDTSNNVHNSLRCETYYDVTNTGNNKIKVYLGDSGTSENESHADKNVTYVQFVKVAET